MWVGPACYATAVLLLVTGLRGMRRDFADGRQVWGLAMLASAIAGVGALIMVGQFAQRVAG